ncbi:uncharacterized membrane-anchored protein YitT (DUF2179 family) [Paenibacillus shirakamiensis]|uniref:Uncharacterized membrane-anchored protein YitT (DUF2179 family) n=1 Tax=Paenibacillus shirakamiensis TaxID=1265935 RepID=A0ABS4JCD6_9BACL|nr:YitT family protein [Paenibacillus shirakamiensis]MBP1999385.1 uncharacterized membrane-anchored protein YitT (DUF2179 family) [Paenibacillus shirakamiensis]
MRKNNNRWQLHTKPLLFMLLGTFVLAFTYYHINFQNHLSEGGFLGLALLGKYLYDLPPAITAFVLDIPVFIVALFLKGRKFLIHTLIASVAFSIFYDLCERFSPLHINFHNNLLLAAVVSGILTGLGAGVILRSGGAAGGDDILSLLISQFTGLKIGTVFVILDAVVLLISLIYMPLIETAFTIVAVVIAGKIITITLNYGKVPVQQPKIRVTIPIKEKTVRV